MWQVLIAYNESAKKTTYPSSSETFILKIFLNQFPLFISEKDLSIFTILCYTTIYFALWRKWS